MTDIDHRALFKAFAQDIVKHANNILSNYTLTRLEYPDDLVEHWLRYTAPDFNAEDEAALRAEYAKYRQECYKWQWKDDTVMDFDSWWRTMADNAKEQREGK